MFSGHADIILDRFQKQKMVFDMFWLMAKESTFLSNKLIVFLFLFFFCLIAALIFSAGYYSAPILYNSKNLNCIGTLSFLKICSHFFFIFELIDLQGPMNVLSSCRYNTGSLSKTKNGLEHVFETCIFRGMKFCLREKSFKSFSNEYIFV